LQKENVFVGHMIFWKQVLKTSHADRIRRERCGFTTPRSVLATDDVASA
jgi:hypothetical protein